MVPEPVEGTIVGASTSSATERKTNDKRLKVL